MKNVVFTFLFLFNFSFTFAQNNIVATGGNGGNSFGSVSYTIGQIDYVSIYGTSGNISEGVQQPYESFILFAEKTEDMFFSIFPNPTTDYISIFTNGVMDIGLNYSIKSMDGKMLHHEEKMPEFGKRINLQNIPSGMYILQVNFQNGSKIKTIKFIKL